MFIRSARPMAVPAATGPFFTVVRLSTFAAPLLLTATSFGQSVPAAKAKTDPDGVPFPDGAIARLGSARFRFPGGAGGPIVFSPDGKLLAFNSPILYSPDGKLLGVRCGGVRVFEVATARLVHQLRVPGGHTPHVVRFLDDGKRIAVGSFAERGVQLTFFSLADGKPTPSPDLSGQRAGHVVDVTPDGSRVFLLEWMKEAYMWDLKAGRELWSCDGRTSIKPLTSDGKWFVRAYYPEAELRDAATGKVVARYPAPDRRFIDPHRSRMSADGRMAIRNDRGDAVAILTARPEPGIRILPGDGESPSLVFSSDSRYLAGTDRFHTQVWDLAAADDKGPIARLPAAAAAGFSPDGKTLALAGAGFVALFSAGDWKALPQSAELPSAVSWLRVTDDGKQVLGYTEQGWFRWPSGGGPAARVGDSGTQPAGAVAEHGKTVAVSADGRVAVNVVRRPEKVKDRLTFALWVTDPAGGPGHAIPVEARSPIDLSPDGRHVCHVAPYETQVRDTRTGEVLTRRQWAQTERVLGLLPAPDGRSFLRSVVGSSTGDRTGDGPAFSAVTVTDHETGRTSKMNPVPISVHDAVRFSRDGTRFYCRGRFDHHLPKDTVSVWDARTGRRLAAWTGDDNNHDAMALSFDNRSFLVGDRWGRLTLVEVATGAERARFQHGAWIISAVFFPDGTKAVASSPEAPVYVWDLLGDPGKWDAAKADAVWTDLASANAKVAFAAIRKLRANPAEAVAFLKERVKPLVVPPDEAVTKLIRALDGPRFAEREKAQKELAAIADLVRPRLEMARKFATEEAGRRLDQVLKATEERAPETTRQVRACEVLEGIGSPEAVKELRDWAAGPEGARLTVEAKESLARR